MQDEVLLEPSEYAEGVGGAPSPSIDFSALLIGVLRRWKLITLITLFVLIATYCVVRLVPSLYRSTVEILVFDPQRQIDANVEKPISPFVDAVGQDAMNTEIKVIKSRSVALRVAKELGLDDDPEFQPHSRLHSRLSDLAERLGFPHLARAVNNSARTSGGTEAEKLEKLDRAADILLEKLSVWPESYIITISITSQDPIRAQQLAGTIANDYLADQREARQDALQRVAAWLKSRVDNLQSRLLETKSGIEKLKAESGIHGPTANLTEKQMGDLTAQMATARAEVDERRARLEQALKVVENRDIQSIQSITTVPSDIQSIPELAASTELTNLRQKQAELNWRTADLQKQLGERHARVIALRAELAGVNEQIRVEAEHMLGNIKDAYDVAERREQALEADLQKLAARDNSEAYVKLQQLERIADADRQLYDSYLTQYNDISERATLQDANARIISPAARSISPISSPLKLYALGAALGLGCGFLLAFLLECRPGVKTAKEIEQFFGRPVMGIIPLVQQRKLRGTAYDRLLHSIVDEPLSNFSEAVRAMRISLELWSSNAKVILITSALPAEGKSTAAMLLAASSATSGHKAVLLDCDLRQQAASEAFGKKQPGLSELLGGTAELTEVIDIDLATNTCVIPAGSSVANPGDLLMSRRMQDLITQLRERFDYIVIDASPLLPVIDTLALATMVDKILLIVEWRRTSRAIISEAFKVLRPEAHRVAGIVLNKVDPNQLRRYSYGYRGRYQYRSSNA